MRDGMTFLGFFFGNDGNGWLQEDGVYKDRNRKYLSLATQNWLISLLNSICQLKPKGKKGSEWLPGNSFSLDTILCALYTV